MTHPRDDDSEEMERYWHLMLSFLGPNASYGSWLPSRAAELGLPFTIAPERKAGMSLRMMHGGNPSYGFGAGERRRHPAEHMWLSISQSCATFVTKHETGLNFPGFRFHIMLWASARYLEPGLGNFGG